MDASSEASAIDSPDPFAEIRRRAEAAGLTVSDDIGFDDEPFLRLEIPNGRRSRPIQVSVSDTRKIESIGFENIRYLGDYEAILDGDRGLIESGIGAGARGLPLVVSLRRIPGAEKVEWVQDDDTYPDENEPDEGLPPRREAWRLRVESGESWIEISPASSTFDALSRFRYYSLKVPCGAQSTHDEALAKLESLAFPFLFDLDLRYGALFDLRRVRLAWRPRRQERMTESAEYPSNEYAKEPLALYRYGRSAQGLPLLEFLAYYQALEYYFPYFSSEEMIGKIRAAIMDPRFSIGDDRALAGLVRLAGPAARVNASEREQIRSTVAACIDAASITQLITADTSVQEHFCSTKQAIKGVKRLQPKGEQDIRHQVADRIYAIRCRIVHAKQDGGESGVELLLPTSEEAASLGPDVDLVRAIVQRAVVARARPAGT